MNSTNRAANRVLLAVTGLLLVAVGAGAVLLGTLPGAAAGYREQVAALPGRLPAGLTGTTVGSATALVLAIAVAAAVLAVVLIVFIARQGRGHTVDVLQERLDPDGRTSVHLAVPRTLLDDHLASRDELVSARVSAYRVRRSPMLKISVRCRRGVPPEVAAGIVRDALGAVDRIVGTRTPALVQISGGFRARVSSRARTV